MSEQHITLALAIAAIALHSPTLYHLIEWAYLIARFGHSRLFILVKADYGTLYDRLRMFLSDIRADADTISRLMDARETFDSPNRKDD